MAELLWLNNCKPSRVVHTSMLVNWFKVVIWLFLQDNVQSTLFSPKRSTASLFFLNILCSLLYPSTTFRSSLNTSARIFLVSRSRSHIKQCSKHNAWPISSWVQYLASCQECHFSVKCLFGDGNSHLDFPCAITISF